MRRYSVLAIGLGLLGACSFFQPSAPDPIDQPEASETVEDAMAEVSASSTEPAGPPHIVSTESDVLFATAEFPADLWTIAPKLDAKLRADAEAEFAQMKADALRYQQEDPDFFTPYGLGLDWELLGVAGNFVSLHGFHYFQTGGAHPNFLSTGLIYDRTSGEGVDALDLFKDAELAGEHLVSLIRADIIKQKGERYVEAGIVGADIEAEVAALFSDSGLALNETAFAASSEPDRLGGLNVYFSPYDIGPYAEGAYAVLIPQSAFREFLKPEFLGLFSGEPILLAD